MYASGTHGLETDWSAYDDIGRHFPEFPSTQDEEAPIDYQDTVFHKRSTGRAWASAGLWDGAVRDFENSASLQLADPEYDWLQLAVAHAHVGKHDEAREWFEKARTSIDETTDPHPELIELRDEAESVLDEFATEK